MFLLFFTTKRERSKLEPLVNDFHKLLDTDKEIEDSRNLLKENRNDKEMESLINEELTNLEECKNKLIQKTTIALLPKDPRDERSVMLEIRAGAGGNEACIWAGDLARMYERYGQKIGWSVKPISACLLYTSPSPRDAHESRMPSSA